ncbi:MAG: hypothetical protein NVSMB45_07740 [Ginsengibacter sp.]
MAQTLFDKLQLNDEKNILIQGLPSTIEKQFVKLSFCKNVTPLLKSRKIDFALVFALNQKQLNDILQEVVPALHPNAKLWVSFPKLSSKIVSDLNRCCTWEYLKERGYEGGEEVVLDYIWSAIQFSRKALVPIISTSLLKPMKAAKKKVVTEVEDSFV